MGKRCANQDTAIEPAIHLALGERQAVRRKRLGTLLIVLGSVWLCMRLAGWIGDATMPLIWVQWVVTPVLCVMRSRFALSVLQVAGAVLALYTIRCAWMSHAEQ